MKILSQHFKQYPWVILISWAIPISIQRIRDMNTAKTKTWRVCEKPEKSFHVFFQQILSCCRAAPRFFWCREPPKIGGFSLPKLEAMELILLMKLAQFSLKSIRMKRWKSMSLCFKTQTQTKGFWKTVMIWFIIQVKEPFMDVSGSRWWNCRELVTPSNFFRNISNRSFPSALWGERNV